MLDWQRPAVVVFSPLKQPSLLCAWLTIRTLGILGMGKSLITFIITIIAAVSSFVVSEHAIGLLSSLNKYAVV